MAPHIEAEQTFALLTQPQDRRYIDAISPLASVCMADYEPRLRELVECADIVQFEYWDHPSLLALLATELPPMRAVFWQHKRTLPKPPGRVVYTSALSGEPYINSGFGFDQPLRTRGGNNIAYLGTVNLTKMSPVFFDVMDRLHARAFVYGNVGEDVEARVREMNHPYRINLAGHTANPQGVLRGCGIFFYPLMADHYGTGENALCEAMSMGLVPVVLNNDVERGIVGDAGIICQDADSCVSAIVRLMSDPSLMRKLSERAIERSRDFSAERSAGEFMALWGSMVAEPLQVLPVVPIVDPERQPAPQRTSASRGTSTDQSDSPDPETHAGRRRPRRRYQDRPAAHSRS